MYLCATIFVNGHICFYWKRMEKISRLSSNLPVSRPAFHIDQLGYVSLGFKFDRRFQKLAPFEVLLRS